jgi:hypothetical protein
MFLSLLKYTKDISYTTVESTFILKTDGISSNEPHPRSYSTKSLPGKIVQAVNRSAEKRKRSF